MKKTLGILLAVITSFSFGGCGNETLTETPSIQTDHKSIDTSSAPIANEIDLGAYEKSEYQFPNVNTENKENSEWEYILYTTKTGELKHITITGYLGTSETIIIPETIDGVPVVSISSFSASNIDMADITDIQFPPHLYFISSNHFDETAWYQNQPDGLVYAGNVAYRYKGEMMADTELVLREGTTGIAGYAFLPAGNSLKSLSMPNTVISIGNGAFKGCGNIEQIHLSENLVSINGAFAFSGCDSLMEISLPESLYALNCATFDKCSVQRIYYAGSLETWKTICKRTRFETDIPVECAK